MNNRTFKILALDGGGIRGVMPAAYLHYVEERIGQPLHRYFDLIVGTSTGGLIALALSREVSSAEILRLYRERGKLIFKRRYPWLHRKAALLVAGSLYKSETLHEELQRILGENTRIGEAACRVCIPAVNVTSGNIVVFKTRHHEDFERDHRLHMWRVAAATAAAPTYFSPIQIPEVGWFADGGLWANSPAMVGVLEGIKLGHRLEDIQVLSLGTGSTAFYKNGTPGTDFFGHARFSLIGWGSQLVNLVMRAQSQRARNFTRYLLPPDNHLRIDFELPPEGCELDAVHMTEMLAYRAHAIAKTTARKVRQQFFETEAEAFIPVPLTTT